MYRIFSIFASIQGESTYSGLPCAFVRFAGCPLRCSYCDTPEARESPGKQMSVQEIVDQVKRLGPGLVEVTGGEPLAQPGVNRLLRALCDSGFQVLLETSGAFSVCELDERVRVIMDVKCPGSGMSDRMCLENFEHLSRDRHELKFAITSREDFDWAVETIRGFELFGRAELLISPVANAVLLPDVAQWILGCGLALRLQVQLHKIIWQDPGADR